MSFDKLNADLLATRKEVVFDRSGLSYLLLLALSISDVGSISFDKFGQEDISEALSELSSSVYRDDNDDFGDELMLIPESPLTQIYALTHKIYLLETTPKKRVPSSFKFL